jgi:hypothetical protein
MNKKAFIIILSVFGLTVSAVNLVEAQVPTVPTPKCVSVPGIPCPGENTQPIQKSKSITTPEISSKTFNDLLKSWNKFINNTIEEIMFALEIIFDNSKSFFQNIKF